LRKSFKIKAVIIILLLFFSFIGGWAGGKLLFKDIPSVRNLEDYSPPIMTRIFSDDGQEIYRFGQEKRILIEQKNLPDLFIKAVIAAEDSRFFTHNGLDIVAITRAMLRNLRAMRIVQGGSTLTQQLAKNLFLKPEKTLSRKIQEAILAFQIEQAYTKEEILAFYSNHTYMGHGRFGIEAASRFYFGKPAKYMTLAESAMLAGILPLPEYYSPLRNPKRAKIRKNYALERMVKEGFISEEQAEQAKKEEINIVMQKEEEYDIAPYFVEEVRRYLIGKYGEATLYRGGLDVYTTLNIPLQRIANEATRKGLEDLMKRHPPKDDKKPEAALVALDIETGDIKALVGGSDFEKSEFDLAVQAKRQAGSAFKPFVLATALENGFIPTFKILDEPTVFYDRRTEDPYQPRNYKRNYSGWKTLRRIIEESINIPMVKLLNIIGYNKAIAQARKMGVHADFQPYPSMALGAFEVTLLNLTSAYSCLPNGGIRMEPVFIHHVVDRTGTMREETKPKSHEALSEQTAFQMVWLLKGVVENGTAKRAFSLNWPLAGKTGTTNDYTDAWFIGYSPSLICGVWAGYHQKKSLGEDETGARAALPIWIDFMSGALHDAEKEDFKVPPGILFVPIDKQTGMRAGIDTGCDQIILEAFKRGQEPLKYCSAQDHFKLSLPYFLQRFAFDENNAMLVTIKELEELLEWNENIHLIRKEDRLEVSYHNWTIPVGELLDEKISEVGAFNEQAESRAGYLYQLDDEEWFGIDGIPASIILINEATQIIPETY
jgi:penicillin-binding protein 1A